LNRVFYLILVSFHGSNPITLIINHIIFIFGVSGSGKTTIGRLLSNQLNLPFFDADDFHPASNIAKMKSGHPLNDDDRKGWLETLNELARQKLNKNGAIISCSALKESYRELLCKGIKDNTQWVYLKGSKGLILARMESRPNHFMPKELLDSQFDALETPDYGIHISIESSPRQIVNQLASQFSKPTEFGIIGLGVMGKSLARNFAEKGLSLSLFNRHMEGQEENIAADFISQYPELEKCLGFDDIAQFVNSLEVPRKILIMVSAGDPVDHIINELMNVLQTDDIIIDGGNSYYKDTNRRLALLNKQGINYIGLGVSGGEEGALKGPSLMPGGDLSAYKRMENVLKSISAKDYEGNPCCRFIGNEGAGHFVKMVHNGIEYAEMQLIAEIYSILRYINKINPDNISEILTDWNRSEVQNYLLESTATILKKKTGDDYVLDSILDQASHKGTGAWTSMAAAELGVPFTMGTAALNARFISSLKESRVNISKKIDLERNTDTLDLNSIKQAYKLARIINHTQGFALIEEASRTYNWNIDLKDVANVWTNGCIIASKLMIELANLLEKESILIENAVIINQIKVNHKGLKKTVLGTLQGNFPIPCLTETLNYINAISQAEGVGNLIQAQRDFFGAHTYKLKDNPNGPSHHTNWLE